MLTRGRSPVLGWRLVLVLALVVGVLGMHSLAAMGMPQMGMSPVAGESTATSSLPTFASPPAVGGVQLVSDHRGESTTAAVLSTADGVRGQGQGVMHECLAVLVTVLLLALIVLAVFGGVPARATVGVSTLRWRRGLAPPWTVPSLAQLSVLRV